MRKKADFPIDFIVTWVDNSDFEWNKEKAKYLSKLSVEEQAENSESRYRDMQLLRYWFRGVEKFAPWVRLVHFVTNGKIPDWINQDNPKIHIVRHNDYIPEKYLPTFNSNVIELGMHRIEGLSEHFVYFNDDMYLTSAVMPDDFFKNGLPRDMYAVRALVHMGGRDNIDYIRMNDYGVINRNFRGRSSKISAINKKINLKYPLKVNLHNIVDLLFQHYYGIDDQHIAIAYRKNDFIRVWDIEREALEQTQKHRFRTPYDVNHWIFRYFRLIEGKFIPTNILKYEKYFLLGKNLRGPTHAVLEQKYKVICLNDSSSVTEFNEMTQIFRESFQSILPEKSSFELSI